MVADNVPPAPPAPPAPPVTQPAKKKRKGTTIFIAAGAVILLLLCCCLAGLAYFAIQRNGKLSKVDAKYAKVKKAVRDVDDDIKALDDKEAKLNKQMNDATKQADDLDAQVAKVSQTADQLSAFTDSWNNRSGSSTDAGLVDQVNAMVAELNALQDQISASLGQFDSLVTAGDAQRAQTEKYADDFKSIKQKLNTLKTQNANDLIQIENKRKQLGILSSDFNAKLKALDTMIGKIDVSSVPGDISTLDKKVAAFGTECNKYLDNIKQRRAIVDDTIAKQAKMTQINQELDRIWPS